jgi:hypothetical protein
MTLKYACSALVGTNKEGIIKPDANGYYRLCIGALNIYNSAGIWYDYEASKHLFDNSASFMRRMSAGNLYSEEDHPQWPIGGKFEDYVARIKRIDPKNICAHIRDIEIVPGEIIAGKQVMLIYASVKPDRERGHLLKAALDNPDQNVCFSIRALCDDQYIGGRVVRTLTDVVTFDWVVEPGISKAHKYNSPALEAHSDIAIPVEAVMNVINTATAHRGYGLESADIDGLREVVARYQRPATSLTRPGAMQW